MLIKNLGKERMPRATFWETVGIHKQMRGRTEESLPGGTAGQTDTSKLAKELVA